MSYKELWKFSYHDWFLLNHMYEKITKVWAEVKKFNTQNALDSRNPLYNADLLLVFCSVLGVSSVWRQKFASPPAKECLNTKFY